jgi:hypothetical protein
MLNRRHFLIAAAGSSIGVSARAASEPLIRDVRTISSIPKSSGEIKDQYDRSKAFSAELLPEDEPLEIKSFAPFLTKSDELEARKKVPNACSRRHVMSVGLEMLNDDQKHLPFLSREQILAYLKQHFVSIQARVYREPVSRALYLGSRCLAATRAFRGATMTKPFSPTVAESVSNIRSLGLLLPERTPSIAANLRTLVMVHKNQLSQEGAGLPVAKVNYELVFIRAREIKPDQLELHAFATTDERTRFHWLKPAESPAIPSDCSVRGAVFFTEYSHQGLYPKSAVIRRSLIVGQKSYPWEKVDKYARRTFNLPAMDSMNQVLDSIITGEFKD